jgi:hypothetical protein
VISTAVGQPIGRFPVDSAENAVHLINALNAEVSLCGGKASPF